MSVEVFIRRSDGTAWKGRIAYNFTAKREDDLKLKFEGSTIPSVDKIYQSYGVSSALEIDPSQLSNLGDLNLVYKFLYGYTLSELMKVDESKSVSYYKTWLNEPQEWIKPLVLSMNWDLFCLSYHTLLCTCNSFASEPWKVMLNILQIMKHDPKILPAILLQCDRTYDNTACAEFWENIYKGLCAKTLYWLNETTCYTAYEALSRIHSILSDDRYQDLEEKCCTFWAGIACKRIDEEISKTHTVKELVSFDGELVFFYKEYFALSSTDESIKKHVLNTTYTFLLAIGDKIFDAGDALGADSVYEAALRFSQNNDENIAIIHKRNKISPSVAAARSAKEKEEFRNKKQQQKEHCNDRFAEIAARVILIAVAICVLLLIIFGVFALLGIFEALAKIVLKIVLAVIGVFVIFMIIMNSLDKK